LPGKSNLPRGGKIPKGTENATTRPIESIKTIDKVIAVLRTVLSKLVIS